MDFVSIALFIILALILVLPLFVKFIEENLEIFLFVMGIVAGLVTGKIWDVHVWYEALKEPVMIHDVPIGIFQVVLIFGLVAYFMRSRIESLVTRLLQRFKPHIVLGFVTFLLGLTSSIISVIVAAVILSEIIIVAKLGKITRTLYSIYSCYALGLGAILTPVGEPLATILVSKLKGAPYFTGPFFLFETFGVVIIPLVLLFSLLAARAVYHGTRVPTQVIEEYRETIRDVILRAVKVYLFVAALILLGSSFSVLVEKYFANLTVDQYYALGILSAVVDNATLAAAMIGPELSKDAVIFFTVSALISGGFLIPGNIPNIIVASRLRIRFRDWAIHALKVGIPVFIITYILLKLAYLLI